jgi:hypothetical protein
MILRINKITFPKQYLLGGIVMETQGLFRDVGGECLNIIWNNFILRRVKDTVL